MFGWIHESYRQLVTRKYGRDTWLKILEIAKFEDGTEREINKNYKDEDTFRLVAAMGSVIGIPIEEVWEAYGGFLIQFTMETGWDELLRAMSPDLEGFLDGLDSLHYFIDHVVYRTKLKGPSFRCEVQQDGSLLLHYYSRRSGLYPIVKGVIREAVRRIFDTEVIMKVQERKQEHGDSLITEHVVFSITQIENSSGQPTRSIASKSASGGAEIVNSAGQYPIKMVDFCNAFPHHFCFDRDLVIEHVGIHMKKTFPFIKKGETKLTDILHLTHPEIPLNFDSIMTFRNSMFVFQMKDNAGPNAEPTSVDLAISQFPITLKGAMISVDNNNYLVFMCSLNVTSIRELMDRNLYISDIQRHDSTRDLIMLNQSRMSQVELNRRLEETTRNLKKMASELETEKQKTEELLCELMPPSVAESLRQGSTVEASEFQDSTVLFTDIVTFTNICAMCTPYDVVNLLNDLYLRFDRLVGLHDVYKVETIGDAYMIVGGVPQECVNHAEKILDISIGMLMESKSVVSPINKNQSIRIRVGVHSGPVVAGVVGVKMPRYCLFGDTVNIANKMESQGIPCKIHVSSHTRTRALQTNSGFSFTERGLIDLKMGKEPVTTYFLEKNERKSVWELCDRERATEHTLDGYLELHSEAVEQKNGVNEHKEKDLESFSSAGGLCSATCRLM
ncbi:unnamed protein product [Bursaphelenchus okinawaensis]|uniref:guanylate cyclase n=1 Tax=Bursaphelenchus okinawaensis TaxID=465554 RepID=A0A811LNG1_9BILA|nr:unnamed protein product [Bursaphelenchus okinawaensis]CAG9125402.1 unnamed protein product [Bursaphelenchus okinawaensis]